MPYWFFPTISGTYYSINTSKRQKLWYYAVLIRKKLKKNSECFVEKKKQKKCSDNKLLKTKILLLKVIRQLLWPFNLALFRYFQRRKVVRNVLFFSSSPSRSRCTTTNKWQTHTESFFEKKIYIFYRRRVFMPLIDRVQTNWLAINS